VGEAVDRELTSLVVDVDDDVGDDVSNILVVGTVGDDFGCDVAVTELRLDEL
jgi:hypothetical protein